MYDQKFTRKKSTMYILSAQFIANDVPLNWCLTHTHSHLSIGIQTAPESGAHQRGLRHQSQSLSGGLPGGAAGLRCRLECGAGLQQNDGAPENQRQAAIAEGLHIHRSRHCRRNLCGHELNAVLGRFGELPCGRHGARQMRIRK